MKNLKTLSLLVLALSFFSYTLIKDKKVNVTKSSIKWTGKKVTGQHEGTIALESGILKFDGDKLIGGEFVIDMTTINVTDLDASGKAKLEGHLKSDDFFGVANHEKATFSITQANKIDNKNYEISGSLSIKGISNPVNFTMAVEKNTASAKVTVDRTKYGIKYGSASFIDNLKDKAINDNFELNVTLSF